MAFRWRADNDPTLNAGLVACDFSGEPDQYCKETLYFCYFLGGTGPPAPPPPSGSTHRFFGNQFPVAIFNRVRVLQLLMNLSC